MQFNKSTFGLAPSQPQLAWAAPIMPGASAPYALPLTLNPALVDAAAAPNLGVQIAVKNMTTAGVFYFAMQLPLQSLFGADGQMERQHFLDTWKAIDDSLEANSTVSDLPTANIETITQKLAVHHVFYMSRHAKPGAEGQEVVYYSCKTLNGLEFMLELTFKQGVNAVKVRARSLARVAASLCRGLCRVRIALPSLAVLVQCPGVLESCTSRAPPISFDARRLCATGVCKDKEPTVR
jgi:AP-1 complex subunit beta-1